MVVVFGEAGARGRHKTVGEQTAAPITGRRLLEAGSMCVWCAGEIIGIVSTLVRRIGGNFWGRSFYTCRLRGRGQLGGQLSASRDEL